MLWYFNIWHAIFGPLIYIMCQISFVGIIATMKSSQVYKIFIERVPFPMVTMKLKIRVVDTFSLKKLVMYRLKISLWLNWWILLFTKYCCGWIEVNNFTQNIVVVSLVVKFGTNKILLLLWGCFKPYRSMSVPLPYF